jgi:hypothetical protein
LGPPEGRNQAVTEGLNPTGTYKSNKETAATVRGATVMKNTDVGREEMTRHLLEAIDQVRSDVSKVELWATALDGFSRPVPDYEFRQGTVWLPHEQVDELQEPNRRKRKS